MIQDPEVLRQQRARAGRYRRSALACVGSDFLHEKLEEIAEGCDEVIYLMENEREKIADALGDEEEYNEYVLAFSNLQSEANRICYAMSYSDLEDYNDLTVELVSLEQRDFDDMLVSSLGNTVPVMGYDTYEMDWFQLRDLEPEWAQKEAVKRLMRKTKQELIRTFRESFGLFCEFYTLQNRYDALKSTLDALIGNKIAIMDAIKQVSALWEKCQGNRWADWGPFDEMVEQLPPQMWVE